MMNRKGYIFVTFVVVSSIIVLLAAFFVLSTKYGVETKDGLQRVIGSKQAELFGIYQEAENARFYVTQAGALSAQKAIQDIARNESGCGTYLGYSLWSTSTADCAPKQDNIINRVKIKLHDELTPLLNQYSDIALPSFDAFTLQQDNLLKIIGTPNADLVITSLKQFDDVIVTHYYVPYEKDFSVWSTGEDPTKYPNYDIYSYCVIPLDKRGFYEEVKCEGSGVGLNGKVYHYNTIEPTKEQSPSTDSILTASGREAKVGETIAVAPNMIPLLSGVQLDFKGCADPKCCAAWSKQYIAADTGQAMRKDWERGISHIDLYVGVGKDALQQTQCLPQKAQVKVKQDTIAHGEFTYHIKPSFKAELDYSLSEYDQLSKDVLNIAATIKNKCTKEENFGICVNATLAEQNDFKWSYECDAAEPGFIPASASNRKQIRACAQSKYSLVDEKGIRRPVVYKISFFTGDAVPPAEVKGVSVTDSAGAEENVTVSFNGNEEEDMSKYEVYYSSSPFTDLKQEGVALLGNISHDGVHDYVATFKLPQDGIFYFAVVAVDSSDNKAKFTAVQGESKDDLNPGPVQDINALRLPGDAPQFEISVIPSKFNTDGSPIKDLTSYSVYLDEKGSDSCTKDRIPDIIALQNEIQISELAFDMSLEPHKTKLELPDRTKEYCLVIIANDEVKENTVSENQYSSTSIISIKT